MKQVLTFKNIDVYNNICDQLNIARRYVDAVDFRITKIGGKYNVEPIQIDIVNQPTWNYKPGAQRLKFQEVVHNCLNRIENTYYNQTASPGIVAWNGE